MRDVTGFQTGPFPTFPPRGGGSYQALKKPRACRSRPLILLPPASPIMSRNFETNERVLHAIFGSQGFYSVSGTAGRTQAYQDAGRSPSGNDRNQRPCPTAGRSGIAVRKPQGL